MSSNGSNSDFRVLTLNVGGINENAFEYYDVFVKNRRNNEKTHIEKFSNQMKKEIAKYLKPDLNQNASLTYLQNIIPRLPISTKKRNQMNLVEPILTNIWFGAKELDKIFATSGFGPGKDKLNKFRFHIVYNPNKVFAKLEINDEGAFINEWLNNFTPSDFPSGQEKTPENIVNYLIEKDKAIKSENLKILNVDNLMGLILFDFLLFKAFKESGLSQEDFMKIKNRGNSMNNTAKVAVTNSIIQSGVYQIIFLQEVDSSMNFNLESSNGLSYRKYGESGSVILVKNDDDMPKFTKVNTNVQINMGKNNNGKNIVKESKEILTLYSPEANFLLVSAHLASKQKEAIPQFQKLIARINRFITSNGASFIMGIDSNIDALDEEGPVPIQSFLPPGINATSPSNSTSRKTRTWLQTQMDKADKAKNKCIDYIITNHNIGTTKIIMNKTNMNANNNGIVLTPNMNWPFDHFAVSSQIVFNYPENVRVDEPLQVETAGVVESAGGAKKRKTRKTKKTTTKTKSKSKSKSKKTTRTKSKSRK